MDSTHSKASEIVAALSEYRSAAITAGVTGKIDVRGWRDPAQGVAPEAPPRCGH